MTRKNVYFAFAIIAVFCAGHIAVLRADTTDELVHRVLRSMDWTDKLPSHELEFQLNRTTKFDSASPQSKGPSASYYELISKVRSRYDASEGKIWIASSYGTTSLKTGPDTYFEDQGASCVCIGDRNNCLKWTIDQRSKPESLKGSYDKIFENSAFVGFSLQTHLFQIGVSRPRDDPYLLKVTGFILDNPDRVKVSKEEARSDNGKEVTVYRLTRLFPKTSSASAEKFVFSNEGFDRGCLIELQQGFLYGDAAKNTYSRDDQFDRKQVDLIRVDWKELELGRDSEKQILPVRMTQKCALNGGTTVNHQSVSLDWKPLLNSSDASFTEEEAVDQARAFRKAIDKKFNR
jgi:hypothetical protein